MENLYLVTSGVLVLLTMCKFFFEQKYRGTGSDKVFGKNPKKIVSGKKSNNFREKLSAFILRKHYADRLIEKKMNRKYKSASAEEIFGKIRKKAVHRQKKRKN